MPDEDHPTRPVCPVPGCVLGDVTTRLETRSGYRVTHQTCAYCDGTGFVSPERYAAYVRLTKK